MVDVAAVAAYWSRKKREKCSQAGRYKPDRWWSARDQNPARLPSRRRRAGREWFYSKPIQYTPPNSHRTTSRNEFCLSNQGNGARKHWHQCQEGPHTMHRRHTYAVCVIVLTESGQLSGLLSTLFQTRHRSNDICQHRFSASYCSLGRRGSNLGVGVRLIIKIIWCDCAKVDFTILWAPKWAFLTEHSSWESVWTSPRGKIH